MKTILLIRHGMTWGNLEKRYIGRTDQELCPAGIEKAKPVANELPACDKVFSSPLLRCKQTAEILFPDSELNIVGDLIECDFGVFEGKTADELAGDRRYTDWVDAGCKDPIPGGEDTAEFKERCKEAFLKVVGALPDETTAAFVIHGGVIMAILETFALPKRTFYEYHLENCEFRSCLWNGEFLTIEERSK